MRALCTDGTGGWTETRNLDEAESSCRGEGRFTWIEVDLGTEGHEARSVAERFGLDALAVEDAFNTRQRPKLESYDEHRFVVLFQLDEIDEQLEARQLGVFAARTYVLVLHDGAGRILEEARRRVEKVDPGDVDVERERVVGIPRSRPDHDPGGRRAVPVLQAEALDLTRPPVTIPSAAAATPR